MSEATIGNRVPMKELGIGAAFSSATGTKSKQQGILELSVVIPCLNEAETIGTCVAKAVRWIRVREVEGEVIVADNGSTDRSRQIAAANGAIVVSVMRKGYGSAVSGGTENARGRYVVMGDADLELPYIRGCRGPCNPL